MTVEPCIEKRKTKGREGKGGKERKGGEERGRKERRGRKEKERIKIRSNKLILYYECYCFIKTLPINNKFIFVMLVIYFYGFESTEIVT